jgi:hypothetical protein
MSFLPNFVCKRTAVLLGLSIITAIYVRPARADEAADAKSLTEKFNKLMDAEDADGAYQMAGEQIKRSVTKQETLAGIRKWFETKGGKASTRELVAARVASEDEAHAMWPLSTAKGNVYIFRYRSDYPNGKFFEDIYVSHDSDGVLRINGHLPQPAN